VLSLARKEKQATVTRGGVGSMRSLGPTVTAQGQSIGISIGMLPQTLVMSRLDNFRDLVHEFSFFIIHIFSLFVDNGFFNRNNTLAKHYTTEYDLEEGFLTLSVPN
jgi:hypothetical protein